MRICILCNGSQQRGYTLVTREEKSFDKIAKKVQDKGKVKVFNSIPTF